MATPVLKKGSKGQDVVNLQNFLNKQGYNAGKADGIFGNQTLNAVKAYQRAKGLSADGIVGPKTWGTINGGATARPTSSSNTTITRPGVPQYETWTPDLKSKPNAPTYVEYKPDYSNRPDIPEVPDDLKNPQPFNPNISMADMIEQARQVLLPQYERNKEKLNDLYTQNQQSINNDSLKRGWARGSFTANRLDTETSEHGKRLNDLTRSLDEQANIMGMQNYDKEYDRQYQLHRDTIGDKWRAYDAGLNRYKALEDVWRFDTQLGYDLNKNKNDYNWKNYDANYRSWLDTNNLNKDAVNMKNDNKSKTYQAQYGQYRDNIQDSQWNKQFGLEQQKFNWAKSIDQQRLNLEKQKAARSAALARQRQTKSAAQKVDPYTLAYNDLINSKDPASTFKAKAGQYASVFGINSPEYQTLQAIASAAAAKTRAQKKNRYTGPINNLRGPLKWDY